MNENTAISCQQLKQNDQLITTMVAKPSAVMQICNTYYPISLCYLTGSKEA